MGNVLEALAGGLRGLSDAWNVDRDRRSRQQQFDAQNEIERSRMKSEEGYRATQTRIAQDREQRLADEAAKRDAATEKEREAALGFINGLPEGSQVRKAAEAAFNGIHGMSAKDFEPPPLDPHTTTELELPEGMRPSFHANGHKPPSGGYKPEDFIPPDVRAATAATADAKKRANEVQDYRTKEEIDEQIAARGEARRREAGTIPITPKDDPTLPRGATAYLSTLPSKHGGDYKAADAEFQQQLPGLLAAHPNLDVRKARQAFNALFSTAAIPRQTNDADAARAALRGGAAPTGVPAPATTGVRPNAAPSPGGVTPQRASGPGLNGRGAGPSGGRGSTAIGAPISDQELQLHAQSVLQQNGAAVTPQNLQMFIGKNRARLEQEILAIRARQ